MDDTTMDRQDEYANMQDVNLISFLNFLKTEGYEITMKNPRHVPGEGYSPSEYYRNIDIEYCLNHFQEVLEQEKQLLNDT